LDRSLSAILPVRNAEATLCTRVLDLIEILPELTGRFELVVVDDCSSDATIEVADELRAAYPQLIAIRHAAPKGRAATIRTGLDHSSGEIVFLTDEGCGLALYRIRDLWNALNEHELVLGTPCRWAPHWENGRWSAPLEVGYQMGHRRAFRELSEVLADQGTLLAHLSGDNRPWHQIEIGPPCRPSTRGQPATHSSDWLHTATAPDDRALRWDEPGTLAGRIARAGRLADLRQVAAGE